MPSRSKSKPAQRLIDNSASSPVSNGGRRGLWLPLILLTVVGCAIVAFVLLKDRLPPQPQVKRDPVLVERQTQPSTTAATVPTYAPNSREDMDNPEADGWATEAFHEQAKKQLNQLGIFFKSPHPVRGRDLAALIVAEFSCAPLLPQAMHIVFEDRSLVVRRGLFQGDLPATFSGTDGFSEALNLLREPFANAEDVRFEFKIFRVTPSQTEVTTRLLLTMAGISLQGVAEQHATWLIRWTPGSKELAPLLKSIKVEDFEQVQTKASNSSLFVDCTESVLSNNACYRQQLLRGMNHWFERLTARDPITRYGLPGIALGDVNGDGLDDLYLCQEPGLPNLLFLQNSDGSLRDVSDDWGVNWLEDSRAALFVDLDNDGDQDLVVATVGNIVVASNENQRGFRVQAVLPSSETMTSLSAADYDRDGRLDLYCCAHAPNRYLQETAAEPLIATGGRLVYHDSNTGAANSMFRNQVTGSKWQFDDVTAEIGLDTNNRRWSFAAAWEDYDNDGDQDLYVANDFGRNNLYRNDQTGDDRFFVDVAAESGVEDSASGMSVTWGDYDRDGLADLYVSNMFSAAGNRITYQANFKPDATQPLLERFQRFARGNTLFKNLGDGTFSDFSEEAAVTMGRWAWGSNFVDVNNDGWDDLVVANGYITGDDTGDL